MCDFNLRKNFLFLSLMEGIYDVKSNKMILYEPISSLVISLDNKPCQVEGSNKNLVKRFCRPFLHTWLASCCIRNIRVFQRESEKKGCLPTARVRFAGWPCLTTLWLCEVYYQFWNVLCRVNPVNIINTIWLDRDSNSGPLLSPIWAIQPFGWWRSQIVN